MENPKRRDSFYCRPDPQKEKGVMVIKYCDENNDVFTVGKVKKGKRERKRRFQVVYLQIYGEYMKYAERITTYIRQKFGTDKIENYDFDAIGFHVYCDFPDPKKWYSVYHKFERDKIDYVAKIRDERRIEKMGKETGYVYVRVSPWWEFFYDKVEMFIQMQYDTTAVKRMSELLD